ncbi:MAG: zinc-binding dehydrogenase, partial [Solibacillus sp.]
VELSEERAAKALELGASAVINPQNEDPIARIHELTNGGVDVAFEVTGIPVVLKQAIDSTTFEGETIIVSIWESEASIQPNNIVLAERTVKGIIAYRDIFPAVMELMTQGYFPADKLVTKRIGLDDVVTEGFETLMKEKNQIKILVNSQS